MGIGFPALTDLSHGVLEGNKDLQYPSIIAAHFEYMLGE